MNLVQLEQRLAALEQKVAALTRQIQSSPAPDLNAWIDEIHGTFQDDATYRRAARFGQQYRKGSSP